MGRSWRRYPPEYKRRIVELVRAGRSPRSLAREFEPAERTIRNWVKQADPCRDPTTEEWRELLRLKRDKKQLMTQRDILRKAATWISGDRTSIPDGGARS